MLPMNQPPPHEIHLPPSTSIPCPVTKTLSLLANQTAQPATSSGVHSRPIGTFPINLLFTSSGSSPRSTPVKCPKRAVAPNNGRIPFTLIPKGAYSAARPFVAFKTAALEALYQTRPPRGRWAPMEAMFMMEVGLDFEGEKVVRREAMEWNMLLTLTFMTRSNSASVTSMVG